MNKKEVLDFFKDLVIIVVIVLVVRTFIIMPFQISGQSMYSSYYDKEFIIIDRLSYTFGKPKRGDVVVFKPHVSDEKKYFLKRIIGLPGDSLKIENGNVFVKKENSEKYLKLDEQYLNDENKGYTFVGGDKEAYEYVLGEGEYFVLGDNRNHSTDSRECFSSCMIKGKEYFINENDIMGKLLLDLGYFNIKTFSFTQPNLGITTIPKFFNSSSTYEY